MAVVNELAVQQFEAELVNSRAAEIELSQTIVETESEINFLLGRYPQNIVRDKAKLSDEIAVKPKVGIPADLLKFRPDIRQAEFDLLASRADLLAAKAAFYPSLNIVGNVGFQGYKAALLFTTPYSLAYSALGSLITPLINRSAIKSEFRAAKGYQLEALYNYQKAILNGYVEVHNELSRLDNFEKIAALKATQVSILVRSIETSTELFKSGQASYVEVLLAQRSSISSRIDLVRAQQERYGAYVNLYKALGGGWQ